jgi:hypothetical protein
VGGFIAACPSPSLVLYIPNDHAVLCSDAIFMTICFMLMYHTWLSLLQVRLGEKEALDGLMAFFEGRAADLKALQYYQVRHMYSWHNAAED